MVTDEQVRRLYKEMEKGTGKAISAQKAGMDEKTARKYVKAGKLPSEMRVGHNWRTRNDPFAETWEEVKVRLSHSPGLEAKTLFEDLQERYPGKYENGQLRSLQRKVKRWRGRRRACQGDIFSTNTLPWSIV